MLGCSVQIPSSELRLIAAPLAGNCPQLQGMLPCGGSQQPRMTDAGWLMQEHKGPIPLAHIRTFCRSHPSSRAPVGTCWGFSCSCVANQLLPLANPASSPPYMYDSQEYVPRNIPSAILHRGVCFQGTQPKPMNKYVWEANYAHYQPIFFSASWCINKTSASLRCPTVKNLNVFEPAVTLFAYRTFP